VSFSTLVEISEKFLQVLKEVEKTMSKDNRSILNWVIDDISKNSLHMSLTPVLDDDTADGVDGGQVVDNIVNGIMTIKMEGKRPNRYFNNKTMRLIKDIVNVTERRKEELVIGTNGASVNFTPIIALNVSNILDKENREYGNIEGRLDMINISGRPRFNVHDDITGEAVKCELDIDTWLSSAAEAIKDRARVSVTGLIFYTNDHLPKKVSQISSFRVIPPDNDLPTFSKILTSGVDFSGGLSTEDFIKKVHYDRS
jgi:hypothetical protein